MEELEALKSEKNKHINKIFWLGLKIALIFAVPALLGVFIGRKLDANAGTGSDITIGILVGTFILSWIITIFLYKKVSKRMRELDTSIKAKKAEIEKNI